MPASRPTASAILRLSKAKSLLVTDLKNIRYLSGMTMSAGCLLVLPRKMVLYADGRYAERARAVATGCTVKSPAELKEGLSELRSCAFEADQVTVARLERWEKTFKRTRFLPRSGVIEQFRRSKTADEVRSIKHACDITLSILSAVPRMLKPGVTEEAIAWSIAELARKKGAGGLAFETIVGFGEHTALPHHHPTARRLRKGDIVQIDMGVTVDGYCSDYSRVYFTAAPSAEQKKAYTALQKAKKSAEKLVKTGASTRALDREARRVLKLYGYGPEFCHSLGHGVGLDIHEGVTLSTKAPDQKLLRGEVITIEPGLYFQGKWGMRIEDTIIVR